MSNGGAGVKTIPRYVTAAISGFGAFFLTISVLYHLSYLNNVGGRSIFLMTFSDYVSLSIAMLPLFVVPLVIVVYIVLSYAISYHLARRISVHPKYSSRIHPWLSVFLLIFSFTAMRTEFAVLLTPIFMIPFFIPNVPLPTWLHKLSQGVGSPFFAHAVVSVIYLLIFCSILLTYELTALLFLVPLLIIAELLILTYVYQRSSTLVPAAVNFLHLANISAFSAVIAGALSANIDKSLPSRVMVGVRGELDHITDGPQPFSYATLENMILLRGMERGLLLWDVAKGEPVFVTWGNIVSIRERIED